MKEKREFLQIQISKELKEESNQLARSKGLVLSSYVRMLLIEKVNEAKKNK
jgi:antitoxin component of RelBE/YafQ-DinJ toxin-antitoxin module